MTRTEYLAKLDNYLRRLPQEDYQEAMDYFTEYFDEAGPENEARVIQELGSPQEAAQAILNDLWDKSDLQEKSHRSRTRILWIALLAIFTAPLTLPAIILAVSLFISFIAVIFAFFMTAVTLLLSAIILLASLIWESITVIPHSLSAISLSIGVGLVIVGVSLLLFLLFSLLAKAMTRLLLAIISRLTKKGKRA